MNVNDVISWTGHRNRFSTKAWYFSEAGVWVEAGQRGGVCQRTETKTVLRADSPTKVSGRSSNFLSFFHSVIHFHTETM